MPGPPGGGDETAYLGGQVSLNPVPHVMREPLGTVLVPLVSFWLMDGRFMFGWASAPYDPAWEERHPRRAAWMALCGPLANFALAAIGFGVLKWGLGAGWWTPPGELFRFDRLVVGGEGAGLLEGAGRFFSILFSLNVLLGVFNLLPFPPLDGSAIVSNLSSAARRARDFLLEMPMGGMLGLLAAWILFPRVFHLIYGPLLDWLGIFG